MDRINTYALVRLGSFVLNGLLILMLYKGCNCERCPQLHSQAIVHDTIYRDTSFQLITAEVLPVAKKIALNANKFAQNTKNLALDTMPCDTVRVMAHELITLLPDTCFYSDTLRAYNDYKIVYDVTVEGKLLDFKLWHANLKPEIKTTITNTVFKKSKPQIYLGAIVGLNNNATNFVFGPSAAIGYKSFLTNYAYDIRSGSHQIGGYWRVWGK